MKIRLSPTSVFWAALDPTTSSYLGGEDSSNLTQPGNQEYQLILTDQNPGPIEVDLNNIPWWAKEQILKSIAEKILVKEGTEPEKQVEELVEIKDEDEDFGLLGLSAANLKRQIKNVSSKEVLEDLLAKEKRGLNQTKVPRTGIITALEEKLKSLS